MPCLASVAVEPNPSEEEAQPAGAFSKVSTPANPVSNDALAIRKAAQKMTKSTRAKIPLSLRLTNTQWPQPPPKAITAKAMGMTHDPTDTDTGMTPVAVAIQNYWL